MQLFLDSVNIEEIKKAVEFGMLDGLTTNPSLMSKAEGTFRETVADICKIVKGDVSIEVTANDYENMIKEAERILTISDNIVIKLPISLDGIKACRYFAHNNVKTNMTLCFSTNQALLAAKAGAYYISPFIGRLDDIGCDGMKLISHIKQVYNNYSFSTKILAASIRTSLHVRNAALVGADVATMSGKVLFSLLDHPLTKIGLEQFNKDWDERNEKI